MKNYPKRTKTTHVNTTKSSKSELAGDNLWNEFTSNISPLRHRNERENVSVTECSSRKKTQTPPKKSVRALPQAQVKRVHVEHPKFSHGFASGLDSQSTRKMRRGKVEIQARLDLHGMTQSEAHISLLEFLGRAYEKGKKTVLVITGKGLSKNGEIGILRQAVPKWLNEQPMRTWIRGFDHAAPTDGGKGALYVLLRRKR